VNGSTDNRASMARRTAERLNDSEPGKYGNSVDAIEKHLRRLLKAHEKERAKEAQAAVENDRLFEITVEQYEAITKANRLLHDPPAKSGDK
jgi:hypothetical protein